jgi:hypothetical protein
MLLRILIKGKWLAGRKGLRIGGRGTIEHHGKEYIRRISEVALTAYVDPSNTSRESPDAGMLWRPKRGRSSNALDMD